MSCNLKELMKIIVDFQYLYIEKQKKLKIIMMKLIISKP